MKTQTEILVDVDPDTEAFLVNLWTAVDIFEKADNHPTSRQKLEGLLHFCLSAIDERCGEPFNHAALHEVMSLVGEKHGFIEPNTPV